MQWLSSLGLVGDILRVIILIVGVLLVFNLMILVHEYGHYLAARWRGLKVEKFYIWFGKPIWKKTINGVEYGLGSIPAGGFVALPQMAPMDALEGERTGSDPLPPITPLDKIIVAFAGPLFSFGLAIVFACLVFWLGKPQREAFVTTTIGYVAKEGPAGLAGLKAGDTILAIDDHPIRRFEGFVDSVRWAVISSEGSTIKFEVDRPGEGKKVFPVEAKWKNKPEEKTPWWQTIFSRPVLREVGIIGKDTPMVGKVQEFSPAADAGIKENDLIKTVDGQPVLSTIGFAEYLSEKKGAPVKVGVERFVNGSQVGQNIEIEVTPRKPDKPAEGFDRYMVGIAWHATGPRKIDHPAVTEQISDAVRSMGNMIAKLLSPKSEIGASHMSGPVGIGRVYYNLLQDPQALLQILWFSVVLNVNLALMNMLPFPVLDGGHITMAIAEAIRRKPLHSRLLEIVQTACALMLFGFLIFVTLKDTGDMFLGGDKSKKTKAPTGDDLWLPSAQRTAPAAPSAPAPAPAPAP